MLYTKKQRAILKFLSQFQKEKGYSPTLEEIAKRFGISRVTAFGHVKAIERKGGVKRRAHESRSIQILDPEFSPAGYSLPLLGVIQAGAPLEAVEAPEVFDLTEMIPLFSRMEKPH
ncbi:MAG: LexA family protein [Planctomycetota bacterium]|jgi:repressor LexA